MVEPTELMRAAIDKAREGVAAGQSPFGCAIARDNEIVAAAHNLVVATTEITAHAEINALRSACRQLQDIHLEGCVVATTCEPCPMCMSALHWARVQQVYFGATIADAAAAGFNELCIPSAELLTLGGSRVTVHGGVLVAECRTLFQEWLRRPDRVVY